MITGPRNVLAQRLSWESGRLKAAGASFAAVLVALLIGAALVAIAGGSPLPAYAALVRGSLGSSYAIGQTLTETVPLLLIALGLALAFRGRMWNIGAEGQLFMGALVGGALVILLPLGPASIPLALIGGTAGGAAWGFLVGKLHAQWGVNEVISSLLLNYVAIFAFTFVIRRPLRDPSASSLQGEVIPASAELPMLGDVGVHIGLLLALALVPAMAWLISRTPFGFRVKVMGLNPDAARAAGISSGRTAIWLMVISGGLAGLAGILQITGVAGRLDPEISQGYGFTAIIVALLGRLQPFGILVAALFIACLTVGGKAMAVTESLTYSIVLAIQGVFVVCLLVADRLARS
jgi:simple sugar transport system permease protein